jgi:hypothetical protein
VTINYFDICRKQGLFGVSETGKKWGINQLANVDKEDIVFFFTKEKVGKRTKGVIYGPYEVISEPFFNNEVVWSNKAGGKDPYSYRVKIKAIIDHFCKKPIPVQRIYDLREEYKIKSVLDTSSLEQRSVCNLFEDEGKLILEMLLQNNFEKFNDTSPYNGHTLTEKTFNFFDAKKLKNCGEFSIFSRESYLEAFLLRNKEILYRIIGIGGPNKNISLDFYNQIGTYIAGGNIDILTIIKENLFGSDFVIGANTIELKNRPLEADDILQLTEYIEWTQRILPRCKREMIHGILIGPQMPNRRDTKTRELKEKILEIKGMYNVKAYQYFILHKKEFKYEEIK